MTRSVTTTAKNASLHVGKFPADLHAWLSEDYEMRWTVPPADGGRAVQVPASLTKTPEIRQIAAALLPATIDAMQAPSEALIQNWLEMLMLCRGSPAFDAMPGVISLFSRALADIPAGAFNAKTQRAAAQKFDFFPSPAAVVNLLQDEIKEIRRAAAVLRYLASDAP
jgi:hypothetical protein